MYCRFEIWEHYQALLVMDPAHLEGVQIPENRFLCSLFFSSFSPSLFLSDTFQFMERKQGKETRNINKSLDMVQMCVREMRGDEWKTRGDERRRNTGVLLPNSTFSVSWALPVSSSLQLSPVGI